MIETQTSMGYADLHMHTTASDGAASVWELLNFVQEQRPHLNVIAITDHDTVDAALRAYERQGQYPFDIVPGIEVTSRAGHILALWVTRPIPRNMNLHDTTAAIREAGGISVLAHPFHIHMPLVMQNAYRYFLRPEVLYQSGVDALEIHNAGILTPGMNWIAGAIGRKIGIAVTGSSDAHTLGAVGSGVTRFQGRTANDLRRAIESAQTVAQGHAWAIKDYIEYLQNMRKRTAKSYSGNINSSQPTNH